MSELGLGRSRHAAQQRSVYRLLYVDKLPETRLPTAAKIGRDLDHQHLSSFVPGRDYMREVLTKQEATISP
jgi:hypothetical protein